MKHTNRRALLYEFLICRYGSCHFCVNKELSINCHGTESRPKNKARADVRSEYFPSFTSIKDGPSAPQPSYCLAASEKLNCVQDGSNSVSIIKSKLQGVIIIKY